MIRENKMMIFKTRKYSLMKHVDNDLRNKQTKPKRKIVRYYIGITVYVYKQTREKTDKSSVDNKQTKTKMEHIYKM